jgi:hypothetical protein
MENDNEMIWHEKLDFYKNKKIMVHIELKDKSFLNASIIERESEKIWVINERKFGIMHLFVSDIFKISEFMENKNEV